MKAIFPRPFCELARALDSEMGLLTPSSGPCPRPLSPGHSFKIFHQVPRVLWRGQVLLRCSCPSPRFRTPPPGSAETGESLRMNVSCLPMNPEPPAGRATPRGICVRLGESVSVRSAPAALNMPCTPCSAPWPQPKVPVGAHGPPTSQLNNSLSVFLS